MAQRKTAPPPHAAALSEIGPYRLEALLRRDRVGEVYRAAGPDGEVRLRFCTGVTDPASLVEVADRAGGTGSPGLAPLLDRLVDDHRGTVAVITPADRETLAEWRRHGRLSPEGIGALGAVLLDGLAALHAAGLSHGAISAAAVGIDPDGAPRWEDAGMLPLLTGSRTSMRLRMATDVSECAAMLRDLGRLPVELEAVVDPVASGMPGAVEAAEPLAAQWREALATAGLAVPPPGVRVRVPDFLPPPPKPPRARPPRVPRTMPRRLGRGLAGLLVLAALGIVPAAALGPGGSALTGHLDDYAPLHQGMRLTYRLAGAQQTLTVTLRVTDVRTVAGVLTASLEASTGVQGATTAGLPLGLGGGTLRLEGDSLVRTVSGGSVRDLVLPFHPGASWRDSRTGAPASSGAGVEALIVSVTETRTLLGPVSLDEPGGHWDRCLAVRVVSDTRLTAGATARGVGTAWYCPGIGLARGRLTVSGDTLDVDLLSAR